MTLAVAGWSSRVAPKFHGLRRERRFRDPHGLRCSLILAVAPGRVPVAASFLTPLRGFAASRRCYRPCHRERWHFRVSNRRWRRIAARPPSTPLHRHAPERLLQPVARPRSLATQGHRSCSALVVLHHLDGFLRSIRDELALAAAATGSSNPRRETENPGRPVVVGVAGLLHPAANPGVRCVSAPPVRDRFRSRSSRGFPAARFHTLRRSPPDGRRTASLRPLPPCRSLHPCHHSPTDPVARIVRSGGSRDGAPTSRCCSTTGPVARAHRCRCAFALFSHGLRSPSRSLALRSPHRPV